MSNFFIKQIYKKTQTVLLDQRNLSGPNTSYTNLGTFSLLSQYPKSPELGHRSYGMCSGTWPMAISPQGGKDSL